MANRKDSRKPEHLVDRLPPHSTEAEEGIIGCVLCDTAKAAECMMLCIQKLPGPEVFYNLGLRTVYQFLCVMHDERAPIDLITLHQRLKDAGQLEACGGLPYLSELPGKVPSAANLDYYLAIVFEKYRLRQLVQTCTEIIGRVYDDPDKAVEGIEDFQKDIMRVVQMSNRQSEFGVKGAVCDALQDIEADIKSGGAITGLTTGLRDLDNRTRGFQPGEFIVIAARPSHGKTAMLMNIADHLAVDKGIPVGVFSMEMPKKALMRRMLASRSSINVFDIADDLLAQQELAKLTNAGGRLSGAPLYIDDTPGLDDIELRSGIRRMVHEHGIKAVGIDYFQLLHTRKRFDNRQLELSHVSTSLKHLFRELNIVGIVAAQLNREAEALTIKGERPRMSHLKDCGSVEQDADKIGIIYPTKADDDDNLKPGEMPSAIDLCKNRNGPTGPTHLLFRKPLFRFELPPRIRDQDVPR